MEKESMTGKKMEKPATTVSTPTRTTGSTPSQPMMALTKARSLKINCLCSPTTHAGSFRCRYHRTGDLTRNSMSVGSKLSDLGADDSKVLVLGAKTNT